MRRHLSRFTFILGITCLLAACGFQLRGVGGASFALPPEWKSMYLETGNPNGEFTRAVIAQLAANGVVWTDRDKANLTLVLSPERFSQRSLSLNAEARVAELELTMSSQFAIRDASNKEIVPPTPVTVIKQVENNPRNVVGTEGEVQLVQNEMRTDLAQQIVRRVSFFAANDPSTVTPGSSSTDEPGTSSADK
jgi:LPS-assembly lipoprotein